MSDLYTNKERWRHGLPEEHMKDKTNTFVFNLTPRVNGGETLLFIVKYGVNSNGEQYNNQELKLNSYCNSASFNLCENTLSPKILREMADELEKFESLNRG